ncbi:MAG: hypothetical protein VX278_01540 [Myxococcota bacterium]|nr:hypothetical protein [Myxococcota bacterium]
MLWLSLLFLSCDREMLYGRRKLIQNIAQGLSDCSENQLSFLLQKYNIQTAFSYCGSNNFDGFSWSYDGSQLYFSLYGNSYILNGQTKAISALPAPPVSAVKPTWLSSGILAVPLKFEESKQSQTILWYRSDGTMTESALSLYSIQDLQRWGEKEILFTAISSEGSPQKRKAYRLEYGKDTPQEVFSFIKEDIDTLSYHPKANLLTVVSNDKGSAYKDETLLFQVDNVKRMIPHSGGEYIALESVGEPISIIIMPDTTGMSQEEIDRAKRKQAQEEAELPDWMPRTYKPNEIHIVDLKNMTRYRMLFFFGRNFEWYTDNDYYCSMTLEGVGRQSINPNVGLFSLRYHLGSLRLDKFDGVEKIEVVGTK